MDIEKYSFENLHEYFLYMLSRPFFNLNPPIDGVHMYGSTIGTVLHRSGQFQTELFMAPFQVKTIEFHTHPNVDSIEMGLAGDFTLESNGVPYPLERTNEKILLHRGFANVPHDHVHGGDAEKGGVFLSFQHWLNNIKPTSVIIDYKLDLNNQRLASGKPGLDKDTLDSYKKKALEGA